MRSKTNDKILMRLQPKSEREVKRKLFKQHINLKIKNESMSYLNTLSSFKNFNTERKLSNSKNDKNESSNLNARYKTEETEKNIKERKRISKNNKSESRNQMGSSDNYTKTKKFVDINFFKNKSQDQNNLEFQTIGLTERDIPANKKTKDDLLRDKKEELIKDENAVKRLEHWELKNIKQDKTLLLYEEIEERYRKSRQKMTFSTVAANFSENNPNSEIAKIQELQTLNEKKKIRDGMLNVSSNRVLFPLMRDIYKKIDQEQGAILLQNINLTKRSFNFDEMAKIKRHNLHPSHGEKIPTEKFIENELVQVGNQVAFRRKDDRKIEGGKSYLDFDPKELENLNVKVDDPFLRLHNLKLEGNYDMLTSTDYYRRTVSDKIRIENIFRKEMMRLSRQLFTKKLEKNNILKKNMELIQSVSQKREKLNSKEDALEIWIKELETNRKNQAKKKRQMFQESTANSTFDKTNPNDDTKCTYSSSLFNYQQQELDSKNYNLINIQKKEIENLKIDYEETCTKCHKLAEINQVNLKQVDEEVKRNKILLSNLMKEQTSYYLELLKKGIDVREEGLCWIIRRLIELNAYFDNHSFPKFVEPYQIDYIVTIAKKQIESIQLKILLKIMKHKQSKLRSNRDFFRISGMTGMTITTGDFSISNDNKIKESTLMSNKTNFKVLYNIEDNNEKVPYNSLHNLFAFTSGFYNQSLSTKIIKIMDGIFKNNDTMMKISYEKKLDDIRVDNIVSQLKKKLKHYSDTMNNDKEEEILLSNTANYPLNTIEDSENSPKSSAKISYKTMNPVLDYFKENIQEKELFNNIMLVRENLNTLEEEISEMIEAQKKQFNQKYDYFKRGSTRQAIHYDLMSASLFGNHVVL